MPDIAKIEAVAAKLGPSEGAEPAPENDAAATPAGVASGSGSAPADGGSPPPQGGEAGPAGPSPGATISAEEIERKLAADRERRAERARKRQADEDAAAAKKAREEAEQAKKDAAEQAEKWRKMPWRERALAEGRNPLEVFNEMREEALKANTPEARFEAMEKAWQERHEALAAELKAEREARENERKERDEEAKKAQKTHSERAFQHDFERTVMDQKYESLRDEYDAPQLFQIVQVQRDNPDKFLEHAKSLGVRLQWEEVAAARLAAGEDLTDEDPTFTMVDILNVLKAVQDRHFKRLEEQRRKKQAAPQTAPEAPAKKAPVAKQTTVNGTAERNAGSSLGNNIAATTAAGAPTDTRKSREQKVKELGEKYG